MNRDALLGENKQAIGALLGGLNLNSKEVDTTLESTKEVVENALIQETKKNGLTTALNLFSNDKNSSASNSFLKNIDSSLVKKLVSNGFDNQKAGSIKELILPFVIKAVASKIGGNSEILSSLLGGLSSGKSKGQGGLLGKFFN